MKKTLFGAVVLLAVLASLASCTAPLGLILDRMGDFHNTVDLADVDGDGDLDAILHNLRNESEFTAFSVTTIWFNDGAGNFTARRMDSLPDGPGWATVAGDIDQDGDVDLVTFTSRTLRLAINQGGMQSGQEGDFASGPVVYAPRNDDQFGALLLGDLNGDSRLDGVVLGCCGRTFTLDPNDDTPNYSWVWLNLADTGTVEVRGVELPALEGLALRSGTLGDLDGDGDLDLFAAVMAPPEGRNRNAADRVLFNDGAGNFIDSDQRLGESDSYAVALGDVDGDGDLDALVGSAEMATLWLNVGGAQGGQAGNFIPSEQQMPGDKIRSLFLDEMNGDGALDAIIGNSREAIIWYNDGGGVFTASTHRFAYSERHGLAVGNLNNDGAPDLFAAEYSHDVRVHMR